MWQTCWTIDLKMAKTRSEIMRSIRSKDTIPEMMLRRALHMAGYRFRVHAERLPGKPDIVLPAYSAAIEVRGCFWHGHHCPVGHIPRTNTPYWASKIQKNQTRDRRNVRALRRLGYRVRVVWGCDIDTDEKLAHVVAGIAAWLETGATRAR